MEQNASSPHRKWYKRLIIQPGIWAILLLPVLLISVLGQEIVLSHYAAEYRLQDAQFQARLLAGCSALQQTQLNDDEIIQCLDSPSIIPGGSISVVADSASVLAYVNTQDSSQNQLTPALLERILADRSDRFFLDRSSPSKGTMLVTLAHIPDTNWLVVLYEPMRAVINQISVFHIGFITGPLSLLLVGIVIFLTLRTVVYPLRETAAQANRIGRGELDNLQSFDEAGVDEIVQLNRSLVTLGQKMTRYQFSMQNYVAKITEVQEAERRRLSHDLHDETMQGLVAVSQRLQLAQRALDHDDKTGVVTRIGQARELNQLVMDELRRTIRALRPTNLEGAGLLTAVASLISEFEPLGITAQFNVEGDAKPIHPEIELATFRVAQEALSNVRRHSQAKHVTVTLSFSQDCFNLDIVDDGVGFIPSQTGEELANDGHYGLVGMQERVFAVGGEMDIFSAEGQGTHVNARLPYAHPTVQIANAAS